MVGQQRAETIPGQAARTERQVQIELERIDPGCSEVVAPSAKVVVHVEQHHVVQHRPDCALGAVAVAAQAGAEVRVADVEQHPNRRRVQPPDEIADRERVMADPRRRRRRIDGSEVLDGDGQSKALGARDKPP